MAERWVVLKLEAVAGAPTFESENAAHEEALQKAAADGDPRVMARVVSEFKRDPNPAVIITVFE